MGIFNTVFGKSDSIDKDIIQACDSDCFDNIRRVIDGDKSKCDKVISYLTQTGNLSMKLRVMTLEVANNDALMILLMTLDSSSADSINKLCKDGLNPVLHFSKYRGLEPLIRVIAHANANLDVTSNDGQTPLIVACENGNTETVKTLINNGAKALEVCDNTGWAALHYACQLGNPEMVFALLKAGANVNVMSSDKLMPIHLAISTAQAARLSPTTPNGIPWSTKEALQCIQLLINSGADLEYVCPYGFSGMSFLRQIGVVK